MEKAITKKETTNSKVGKTYPRVCKTELCDPQDIYAGVVKCKICKKLDQC